MSLFDRFRKTPGEKLPGHATDVAIRKKLVELILGVLRDKDGRIHAEDAISAAATVVAERCIDAAGDFPLRDHQLTPGSRAFSTRANELICSDVPDAPVNEIPVDSILGSLRKELNASVYSDAEFPEMKEVFSQFAARIGDHADWGKVPLSVGKENFPFMPPLRVGYETRSRIDKIFLPIHEDKLRCLRVATGALADILMMVATTINHRVALMLAIETINGMSKTVPMTERAMKQVRQENAKEP